MSSYNLKRLLQPKSIALFGGLWIENVANQIKNSNFKGNVWPINPHRKSIAGYKCFQDISDLPGVPDTAFIGVNRTKTLEILTKLNELGGAHGIGRLDLVEGRFVGMKSRGIYETPGGTILLEAHRGIEQITLDRGAAHLKDELMPKYAELIYNGFWYSPEREMLQSLIDKSQKYVSGTVRLKLYKGSVSTVGRWSEYSLYSEKHVTFEDDAGAYDQNDAAGFIQLNALRLKLLAHQKLRNK